MKKEQIKFGMFVSHITNPAIKMIVVGVFSGDDNEECIVCEWMSTIGEFHQKDFRPIHLQEYVLNLEEYNLAYT